MEQVNFGQSLKNIPVPDNKQYSQMLISSADRFLETMKWKLFHHFNPPKTGKKVKANFGFPTMKAAPRPAPDRIAAKPFKEFDDGLLNIIQNVEF